MYVVIEEKELVAVVGKLVKAKFGMDPEQVKVTFRASPDSEEEEAIVTFDTK